MDYETRKAIAKLEARIRELEARLAVSEMPEEVSALIEDLQLVPDTNEDDKVSLEMLDEFLKDMGYHTRKYQGTGLILFTDMFKDYELRLRSDGSIELILGEELDPDVNRNILYLITSLYDLSASVSLDLEKELVKYSVGSVTLKPDTYCETIRFFINLLDESSRKLQYHYRVMFESSRNNLRPMKHS